MLIPLFAGPDTAEVTDAGHWVAVPLGQNTVAVGTVIRLPLLQAESARACVAVTRGLAMELAADNIRVNAVSLGIVDTPLHVGDSLEDLRSFAPLNRVATVADVVRAVLYL